MAAVNETEQEINLTDIIKFFIKHRKIIFILPLCCGIVATIHIFSQRKVYVAESALIVLGTRPEVTFEPKIQIKEITETVDKLFEERKKTLQELIKTPTVIAPVITKAEELNIIPKGEYNYEDFSRKDEIIKIEQMGEVIKIKVTMPSPEIAKYFADEIAKSAVQTANILLSYEISKETIETKLKEAKDKYNDAFEKYNLFVKNNQIMALTSERDRLQNTYNYYNENISAIDRYIWQAKSLREQLQKGSVSSSGELANSLALLRFKASIFAGEGELPIKFDISQPMPEKISGGQSSATVEDVDNIIDILQKRKKEYEKEIQEKKFEQQIQELTTKIEEEKKKEREYIKDRDLSWEAMVALERKKEEVTISKGITENILVKIAYFSELPRTPEPGKRKITLISSLAIGLILGIVVSLIKEVYGNIKSQI